MANIDKELHQIKNAVYGREVRGSIHDGIKKINEESEDSKSKATEAHDVMESIMTEGFDNAALEANFEQKLDDKISNLQPEWTQFKNDTETQLADTNQQVNNLRNTKANKNEVNQLAREKADITYVDDKIANLDGLQIKGAFDTLADLKTAYPNGTSGLFVIHADNHWYYWDGSAWAKGNEFATIPWAAFMTTDGESWVIN